MTYDSCEEIEKKIEAGKPLSIVESNDVVELMNHIQKCTYNSLTVDGASQNIETKSDRNFRLPPYESDVTDGAFLEHYGLRPLLYPSLPVLRVTF